MEKLTPQEVQSWYKIITDFPGYYNNFVKNFSALVQQGQYIREKRPELLPEYNRLLESGSKTYAKLQSLKTNVDKMRSIWSDVTGWLRSAVGLEGLGIAPIIWAGMATGAAIGILTGVANWLTEVSTFAARVEEAKRLEAKGLSPSEVTRQLKERFGEPGSGGSFFGIPIKAIMLGIIGLIALPTILNILNRQR